MSNETSQTVCYDYDNQCWVGGSAAVNMMCNQVREDLELLESDGGRAYAAFVGGDYDTMLDGARRQLADLERLT